MARRQSTDPAVTAWAEELPSRFLACRDHGHAWSPYLASYVASSRQYRRTLRCHRCKTERTQMISQAGQIESGFYSYPDGYAMPPGAGGYTQAARNLCHLTSVVRLVESEQRKAS